MARVAIDEIGNQYSRLTVLRRDGSSRTGHALWRCLCGCGNEVSVVGYSLRRGDTQSCGCLQKEMVGNRNRLPESIAAFNKLFNDMMYQAKLRGYDWDLTKEQVYELTSQVCFYCGKEPCQVKKYGSRYNGDYIYNGLDRVDNDKGYTIENVVPCCGQCNRAKTDMTEDEFLQWIEQIYLHSARKV